MRPYAFASLSSSQSAAVISVTITPVNGGPNTTRILQVADMTNPSLD